MKIDPIVTLATIGVVAAIASMAWIMNEAAK